MLAQGDTLLDYIPQRPPMVMIGRLEEASENRFVSGFTVGSDHLFVTKGHLREPGIIENIAQTAAAGVGYLQKTMGKPVTLGFIAAIRNLQIHLLPVTGQELRTIVEVVNKVVEVTIIHGEVYADDSLVASCEMRIFIQPES